MERAGDGDDIGGATVPRSPATRSYPNREAVARGPCHVGAGDAPMVR